MDQGGGLPNEDAPAVITGASYLFSNANESFAVAIA
jgi:hypothetical protein